MPVSQSARRPGRRVLAVVLACLLFAVTACRDGEGEDTGGGAAPATPVADAPAADPPAAPVVDCPDGYTTPLEPETDVAEEQEYLDDISACTDDTGSWTWIENRSDAVWLLEADGSAPVDQLTETPRLLSFRATVAAVYQYAVLAPESAVQVQHSPNGLAWRLSPSWSTAWLMHEQLADKIREAGEELTADAVRQRSARWAAVAECSLAAWDVAGDAGDGLSGDEPAETVLFGMGVVSGTSQCASAWRQADQVTTARVGAARVATWERVVVPLADNTQFLQRANGEMTLLNRLGKALAIAFH